MKFDVNGWNCRYVGFINDFVSIGEDYSGYSYDKYEDFDMPFKVAKATCNKYYDNSNSKYWLDFGKARMKMGLNPFLPKD